MRHNLRLAKENENTTSHKTTTERCVVIQFQNIEPVIKKNFDHKKSFNDFDFFESSRWKILHRIVKLLQN